MLTFGIFPFYFNNFHNHNIKRQNAPLLVLYGARTCLSNTCRNQHAHLGYHGGNLNPQRTLNQWLNFTVKTFRWIGHDQIGACLLIYKSPLDFIALFRRVHIWCVLLSLPSEIGQHCCVNSKLDRSTPRLRTRNSQECSTVVTLTKLLMPLFCGSAHTPTYFSLLLCSVEKGDRSP